MVICFDAAASPTRTVQRVGRTGRHKSGRVIYLLSEGKEEAQFKKNQQVEYLSISTIQTIFAEG